MITIAKRNIKLFFRDKSAVFFSLLSVLIIIGLYVLFLGDVFEASMEGMPGARFLMDSWIMAGLLAVTSITTTMGAFGVMVEDRTKKISKDFSAAPIKKSSLAGGYILSAYCIGVIMSIVALALFEIYIIAVGGELMPLLTLLKTLGLILISVLASSSMVFFMVTFFKSQNAFATASTIIGTLIGFITGIYMPIGNFPSAVQAIIKIFPVSHAGTLFRQVIMEAPMATTFAGVPAETVEGFREEMGIVFHVGSYQISALESILILIATAALFYGLAIWKISRKKTDAV